MSTSRGSLPPNALRTRLKARVMGGIASAGAEARRQRRARLGRRLRRAPPAVRYFHQVDDPYSHLAVQRLDALAATYAVQVEPWLVPAPAPAFLGDADRHPAWALADARDIAPFHGVEGPGDAGGGRPDPAAVFALAAALATRPPADFAAAALDGGRTLWRGAPAPTPSASAAAQAERSLREGARQRARLGHYAGAMFEFDGDWYWGLDRLPLLEARLRAEGFLRDPGAPLVVPRPQPDALGDRDARAVRVELFPSLRSPYTAVSFPAVQDLMMRTAVAAVLRPVMPMMMRGVAAPRAKQLYILRDAAREGRRLGVAIGPRPVDPFGEPVRRALSLWKPMHEAGCGMDFIAEYLRAAWIEGLDVTRDAGLLEVVRRAGAEPADLVAAVGGHQSDDLLQENLEAMLGAGLWGVPSFRVSGGGAAPLACWGQDRLWRIETEIARRARPSGDPQPDDRPREE
ncbi:MAG: DsbA family protein [Pseudomonadales bacterium]|jgi:2-hydroxychromene-2-carboxylate isomerase|nr:DsbA family protein [Pseudomonadales bacterium]